MLLTTLLTLLAFSSPVAYSFDRSQCIAPLGMESGAIPDDDIRASSSFDSGNVGPQHGRVRTENGGGAWCPRNQITAEAKEWIEIQLDSVHVITATESQGRFGNGQGQEYAESYLLEYWRPRLAKWVRYRSVNGKEILKGNSNTYIGVKEELDPPIWASKIRFYPYSSHMRTVCMRVEIYGCPWTEGVVSYSMPQGDKRGSAWQFFDATYDGHWDKELQRGLGELTDGKVGPDSFKMAYDYGRGVGWVGWKNDTRVNQPIEIKFEFDKVREFNSIHIFCNNEFTKDIQVFSEVKAMFSVGGEYYSGEPISFSYMEDRIFEYSRNVSIKLHRRVGKFVKLQLFFANRWIMISEVTFDSINAHGNFTAESPPNNDLVKTDVFVDKERNRPLAEIPLSDSDDHTLMAVIIGVLMAVIILLTVCIFLIISRHRERKCFASPLSAKSVLPPSSAGSSSQAYSSKGTLPLGADTALLMDIKTDDYQEPYQALKYAPYYSYSTVLWDLRDISEKQHHPSDSSYDYAVPEVNTGTQPLLKNGSLPHSAVDKNSLYANINSSRYKEEKNKKTPIQENMLIALKRRLEQTSVPEFPRHRLRMITQLGAGAFGTVYVAEADGIPEYGLHASLGKRPVAVKFLLPNASEKEKLDFQRDVRILSALDDVNLSRVLGVCWREEPYCVIMEYLEHGDLNQFLKSHILSETPTTFSTGVNCVSFNCLLYMGTQIASGMRYLETLNFVHRDLATRNCLVGKGYQMKISDFGTDNEAYADDYHRVNGSMPLPVRWMAWETLFLGRYTPKSDVWSFGVLLWEMLEMCRSRPYGSLTDDEVVENLRLLSDSQAEEFLRLPRPSSKDMADLISDCCHPDYSQRPTFSQIHLFLQRKNLGYQPPNLSVSPLPPSP